MLDLIREMFLTPDAHADAYGWASALLAHAMLGVVFTALLGWCLGAWRGAAITALAYAVLWEGGQLALAGADLADCAVDALAVACGALIAAAAWRRCGRGIAAAMAVLAVVLARGVSGRK